MADNFLEAKKRIKRLKQGLQDAIEVFDAIEHLFDSMECQEKPRKRGWPKGKSRKP